VIIDGRDLPDGDVRRADVCVVGAGAAGITIALELRGYGLDVVVLEGGGLEAEPDGTALYDAEMVGELFGTPGAPVPLTAVRLRYLGGTTNHWAGYCRPQESAALNPRPHRPGSGWPIDADELARWYTHVSPLLQIDTPEFDWQTWAERHDLEGPLLDGGGYTTRVNQYRPVRFGQVFRPELEQASDVEVILHATATEVLIGDNTDTVDGVAVAVLGGPRFTVEARAVVVALGGLENPRLLLASDAVRTAGLGNAEDHVGRYFCEHPQADLGIAVLDRTPEQLGLYRQIPLESNPFFGITSFLVADEDLLDRHELLGIDIGLIPFPYPDRARGDGLATTEVGSVATALDTGPLGSVAVVRAIGEQELNPDSRVLLSNERDALGMPKLQLDWRFLEIDRRSMLTHLRLFAGELGRQGRGRLQLVPGTMAPAGDPATDGSFLGLYTVDPEAADPEGFHLAYGCHHMCTTRMATSPGDGVVDTDCRVFGTANLYVAGGSVFPVAGTAPPTFTIVALAARLAAHLASRVSP
jgi:choline dehydrogenase-like flavoprotein